MNIATTVYLDGLPVPLLKLHPDLFAMLIYPVLASTATITTTEKFVSLVV